MFEACDAEGDVAPGAGWLLLSLELSPPGGAGAVTPALWNLSTCCAWLTAAWAAATEALATLEALGNLRSPAVVDEVIELLDDPEESLQRAAFQALEAITGKRMGETFPADEQGRKFLIARWRAWREKGLSSRLGKETLVACGT